MLSVKAWLLMLSQEITCVEASVAALAFSSAFVKVIAMLLKSILILELFLL